MEVKIALIGGGNVGQGFLAILRRKSEEILTRYGVSFALVSICDRLAGSLLSSGGLKIQEILPLLEDGTGLHDYTPPDTACVKGLDALAGIELSRADVVLECTYSDIMTGEPATSYIRKALSLHKHVITSNKGPVALHFNTLRDLARANGVQFRFDGAVMSGTPVVDLIASCFRADNVLEVRGILNVTTNHILAAAERGMSVEDAQREAREMGMMEANPDLDLDGHDSMAKLLIIVNLLTGGELLPERIKREGIRHLSQKEIQAARDRDSRFRMLSHAWKNADGVWYGEVGPVRLPSLDPLSRVDSPRNALMIRTEDRGEIFLEGPGSGKTETGCNILSDLLSIYV